MELHMGWCWKSSAMPGKGPLESCKSCRWDSSNSEPHSIVFCILWLFRKHLPAFGSGNTFVKAKFSIIKPLLQLGSLGNQIYIYKHSHTPHQLSVLHLILKELLPHSGFTLDLQACSATTSHLKPLIYTPLLLGVEHVRVITLMHCPPSLWINQGFQVPS